MKPNSRSTSSRNVLTMGFTTGALIAIVFAGFSADAKPDHAAFRAAAIACGLPKPGEGRPTDEQKARMEKAGFSRPPRPPGEHLRGHRHHQNDGETPPPAPPSDEGTSSPNANGESSTAQ